MLENKLLNYKDIAQYLEVNYSPTKIDLDKLRTYPDHESVHNENTILKYTYHQVQYIQILYV